MASRKPARKPATRAKISRSRATPTRSRATKRPATTPVRNVRASAPLVRRGGRDEEE